MLHEELGTQGANSIIQHTDTSHGDELGDDSELEGVDEHAGDVSEVAEGQTECQYGTIPKVGDGEGAGCRGEHVPDEHHGEEEGVERVVGSEEELHVYDGDGLDAIRHSAGEGGGVDEDGGDPEPCLVADHSGRGDLWWMKNDDLEKGETLCVFDE